MSGFLNAVGRGQGANRISFQKQKSSKGGYIKKKGSSLRDITNSVESVTLAPGKEPGIRKRQTVSKSSKRSSNANNALKRQKLPLAKAGRQANQRRHHSSLSSLAPTGCVNTTTALKTDPSSRVSAPKSSLFHVQVNEKDVHTAKQFIIQAKSFAKKKDISNISLAIQMYQKAQKLLGGNEKLALRIVSLENRLALLKQSQGTESPDARAPRTKLRQEMEQKIKTKTAAAPVGKAPAAISTKLVETQVESAKLYIIQAKKFSKTKDASNFRKAIAMYKKAQSMLPYNEKLVLRISSLENRLKLMESKTESADAADVKVVKNDKGIKERLAEFLYDDDDDDDDEFASFLKRKDSGNANNNSSETSEKNAGEKRNSIVHDPLDELFAAKKRASIVSDPLKSIVPSEAASNSVTSTASGIEVTEKEEESAEEAEIDPEVEKEQNYQAFLAIFKMKFNSSAVKILIKVIGRCQMRETLLVSKKKSKFEKFLAHVDSAQSVLEKFDNTKKKVGRRVRFCAYDLSTISTPESVSAFPEKKSDASTLAQGMEALCKCLASICLAGQKLMVEASKNSQVKSALGEVVNTLSLTNHSLTVSENRVAHFYGKVFECFSKEYSPKAWKGPFSDKLSSSLSSLLRHHMRCALNKPASPIRVTSERLLSDMHDSFLQMIPASGSFRFNFDDVAAVTHRALRLFAKGEAFANESVRAKDMVLGAPTKTYSKALEVMLVQWEYVEAFRFLKSLLGHRFIRDAYMCSQVHAGVEGAWEALQKFGELTSRFKVECPDEQILAKFGTAPNKFYSELCQQEKFVDKLEANLAILDAINVSERYSDSFNKLSEKMANRNRRRSSILKMKELAGVQNHVSVACSRFRLPKIATDAMQDVDRFLKSKREGKFSPRKLKSVKSSYLQQAILSQQAAAAAAASSSLVDSENSAMKRPTVPFKCPFCISNLPKFSEGEVMCQGCNAWHHLECLNLNPKSDALETFFCQKCYLAKCIRRPSKEKGGAI